MGHLAIFPGSFDPIHYGHINIAERAAKLFDEILFCVYASPAKSNVLFSTEERVEMAKASLAHIPNLTVVPYSGLTVNYAREVGADAMIRGLRIMSDFDYEFRMTLINKIQAPEIETVSLMSDEEHIGFASSVIKELASLGGDLSRFVPPLVAEALKKKYESR